MKTIEEYAMTTDVNGQPISRDEYVKAVDGLKGIDDGLREYLRWVAGQQYDRANPNAVLALVGGEGR